MKLLRMDFRICAFLMVCLSLSEGVPQKAINSLQGSRKIQPGGKVSSSSPASLDSEDPRKAKIMKQINKVNDDGSYTFGYEADDGSFRVETRTKEGLVKGKYGYVDANGQLKVMEYTAGEKTEAPEPESDEVSDEKPTSIPTAPRYLTRFTKSAPLPPASPSSPSVDQSAAAQTPNKVTQVKYNSEDEESDDDDKTDDDESSKDVNNGQYFRAVQPSQSASGPAAGASRRPQVGGAEGPRYVPTTQLAGGQYASGSPQGLGQGGFQQQQFRPQQYAGGAGAQGFGGQGPQEFTSPVLRQQGGPSQYSGQPGPASYLGQQGPSPYAGQQGQSPYSTQQGQSPYSTQQGGSPYAGQPQQYDSEDFDGQGPQQFGRGPNPNVQIQFRGSPNDISTGEKSQQSFPGAGASQQQYPGFEPGSGRLFGAPGGGRQLGGTGQSQRGGEQYIPSVDLDGFSEDADEDGYVDDFPKGADGGSLAQAQEKQGQAVKAGSGSRAPDAYRPQVLGPQGVLQGGRVQIAERQQPGQGGQGGQGGLSQLTEEQIQQLIRQSQPPQYQGGQGGQGQGIPQQFLGQQQFGGFPGQGQGFPQQQSQFLGAGRPGLGGQQGQFLGQQNPSLQGQYVPGQGQGSQFSGFPQQQFNPQEQYRPQGQQGQFLGQGQGLPQGFLQGGGQGLSSLSGQGGGSQGSQFGQGSPQGQQGGSPQSAGLPFEFNPYGGLPGQGQGFPGQSQGFSQGFPGQGISGQGQGFPGQSQGFPGQSQGFPGQGFSGQSQGFPGQSQGFPGQSQGFLGQSQGFPGQAQGFPSQGLSQQGGFPGLQGGFPGGAQQGGFAPGSYPGAIQGQQQGQIPQSLLSGRSQGTQLGGGQPRPVQSGGGGGLFGAEARKVTSAAPETTTK